MSSFFFFLLIQYLLWNPALTCFYYRPFISSIVLSFIYLTKLWLIQFLPVLIISSHSPTPSSHLSTSRTVDYVFSITSTSLLKGSVKGGTTVMLKGQGFGSDCSRLKVLLGKDNDCDEIVCDNESLTCVTRVPQKMYEITNTGFSSGKEKREIER